MPENKMKPPAPAGRRAVTITSILILLAAIFGVVLAQADGPNKVALVVTHGDGQTVTKCVEFSEDQLTGLQVLEKSGLAMDYEVQGMGATICKLDGEGCSYPGGPCFCQCQGSSCTYWSYWQMANGAWQYSSYGASNTHVSNGGVEGWIWGAGTTSSASPPPVYTFEQICGAPTNTSTATNTQAPAANSTSPAATPTKTKTPVKTSTPRPPTGAPKITKFSADKTSIAVGDKATLTWSTSGAAKVYLEYVTTREVVDRSGSRTMQPGITTAYTLIAQNSKGKVSKKITIKVSEPTGTPPPTEPPTNTPRPKPSATPTETPTPTNTPTSTKTPVPSATASPTRTLTPTPTFTITPTPTHTPTPTISPTPSNTPTPRPIAAPPTAFIKVTAPPDNTGVKIEVTGVDAGRLFTFGIFSFGLLVIVMTPIVLLIIGIGVWYFANRR